MPHILLQTSVLNSLHICDAPPPLGGVILKSGESTITVDPSGVRIVAPKIEINGLTIINQGALTVLP